MISSIIEQWENNKSKLENYFRTTDQYEYCGYKQIVEKLFELCITNADEHCGFNIERMIVIDDGDYQGTKLFIIPKDTYQPSVDDYITTHTYYGSCSGCDTLQSICGYDYGLPTEEQVKLYMTLALHLVQKLRWLE
jgi:hypothetical protein